MNSATSKFKKLETVMNPNTSPADAKAAVNKAKHKAAVLHANLLDMGVIVRG